MYDARASTKPGNGMGHLVFSALVLFLVVGAFLGVLLWPTKTEIAEQKTQEYRVNLAGADNGIFDAALPKLKPARFQNALRALDQVAYKKTETALFRSRNQDEAMVILINQVGEAFGRNRRVIAQAPVQHFDEMLGSLKKELRSASRKNASWCAGDQFGNFADNPPRPDLGGPLIVQFVNSSPELSQHLLDMSAMVFEAGADGRANGTRRSAITAQDEAILEGVFVSMLTDPQIMRMLMAVNPETSNEAVLARMDFCALGASAITALGTIPQDTKGRVWAEMVSGGRDMSKLGFGR